MPYEAGLSPQALGQRFSSLCWPVILDELKSSLAIVVSNCGGEATEVQVPMVDEVPELPMADDDAVEAAAAEGGDEPAVSDQHAASSAVASFGRGELSARSSNSGEIFARLDDGAAVGHLPADLELRQRELALAAGAAPARGTSTHHFTSLLLDALSSPSLLRLPLAHSEDIAPLWLAFFRVPGVVTGSLGRGEFEEPSARAAQRAPSERVATKGVLLSWLKLFAAVEDLSQISGEGATLRSVAGEVCGRPCKPLHASA